MNQANANRSSQHHVVIGAGATGTATAKLLVARGHRVTVITRSGSGPVEPGIELVAADASNRETLTGLTVGAAAIYNCANPPYDRWITDWPPLANSLLAAAEANDAVLVTLSNLYVYADPIGPMHATDPLDPSSVKGGIRAKMWQDALAAHQAGRVRVTEARASDFIGPGTGANGHMGDRVVEPVLKGKSVSVMGRADVEHSWSAIDDVAETLVTIGSDERAWGRAWHVPTAAPMTQRELIHRMCSLAGIEPVKVRTIPKLALTVGGVFVPMLRELKEMRYQFTAPFVLDSQETTNTFGQKPTPLDDTLRAMLASYK
ncbi:MAG: NAD-dependent epimerase/dehydratase family protein [Acidimicrobiales bacterium]